MPRIYPYQVDIGAIGEENTYVNVDAASTHIGLYGDASSKSLLVDLLAAAEGLIDAYMGFVIGTRVIQEQFQHVNDLDYVVLSQPRAVSEVTPPNEFTVTQLYDPELILDKRLDSNGNNLRMKLTSLRTRGKSTLQYTTTPIAGPLMMRLQSTILTVAQKMNRNRSLIEEPNFDLLTGTSLLLPQNKIISV